MDVRLQEVLKVLADQFGTTDHKKIDEKIDEQRKIFELMKKRAHNSNYKMRGKKRNGFTLWEKEKK